MTATQNLGILLITKLRICDWKSVNAKSNNQKISLLTVKIKYVLCTLLFDLLF